MLGLLIALLSFVFWKLDQRGSMLIKHAEVLLERLEPQAVGAEGSVFSQEPASFAKAAGGGGLYGLYGLWTFGRSLRLIFLVMGIFGVGGATLSALRFAEVISWEKPSVVKQAPENAPTATPTPPASATPAAAAPTAAPR